jgi:hypothetical protein
VLDAVERGEMEATVLMQAQLRGAVAALEAVTNREVEPED